MRATGVSVVDVRRGTARGLAVALLLICGSTAACSDGGDASAGDRATQDPAPSAPTSTPPYDPLPWTVIDGPLGRCGPVPHRVADQTFTPHTVRDPGTAALPAVTAGHGRTVAVLVHQTDGNGLCGWLSFAQHLAHEDGVTALAFDLCTYGESECRPRYGLERQVDQVRLAVDYAVGELHARRVVLVGASMGGSLAVLTAAQDRRVDAVVDLSGPDDWAEPLVHEAARGLRAPALYAVARSEGADWVAAARQAEAASPSSSRLVVLRDGHGYELLEEPDGRPTAFSRQVLDWVTGT